MAQEVGDGQRPTYENLEEKYREISRTLHVMKNLKGTHEEPFVERIGNLNSELTDFVDGLGSGKISALFGLKTRCEKRYRELVGENERTRLYRELIEGYLDWSASVNDAVQNQDIELNELEEILQSSLRSLMEIGQKHIMSLTTLNLTENSYLDVYRRLCHEQRLILRGLFYNKRLSRNLHDGELGLDLGDKKEGEE